MSGKYTHTLLCLLTATYLLACGHAIKPASSVKPRSRAIIFLPGYRGSELREKKTGDLVWISLIESLWGNRSLIVSDDKDALALTASGVLLDIPILGPLFKRNVYGDWVSHLQRLSSPTTKVILFPYDWRQDNVQTVRELSKMIDELHQAGTKDIDVVAHSMGALVVAYYLRYGTSEGIEDWSGAKQIRHAVLVNPPFHGTVKLVRDFQRGSGTGFNEFIMSAEAIRSFTSCFQLLPSSAVPVVLDEHGLPLELNLFNIETWHRYSWGPFGYPAGEKEIMQFQFRLQRGESFVEYLDAPDLYPNLDHDGSTKLLNVQSKGVRTQTKCYSIPKYKHRIACNENDLQEAGSSLNPDGLYEDGDGTIGLYASTLPGAFSDSLYTENRIFDGDHLSVLENPGVREAVFRFLNQGSAQ